MKTIHITHELEQFLHEMVQSGRYASEESVISDALEKLRQTIDPADATRAETVQRADPGKPLTKQRFQRHLVEIGLLDDASEVGIGDGDELDASPIDNDDEILSDVLIRERLIEWLTSFLDK